MYVVNTYFNIFIERLFLLKANTNYCIL